MRFNPTAITFWMFTAGVGYLVTPTITGAVTGLVIGLAMSLAADILL